MSAGLRPPLAPRQHQHQPRLTPLAAQDGKQQEQLAAADSEPAALPAGSTQQEGIAGLEFLQQGVQSPMGMAAEPSQQLGLSSGMSADRSGVQQQVALEVTAGEAGGGRAGAEQQAVAAALPALTAVPEGSVAVVALAGPAAAQGGERQRPYFSGWAREWGQLLRCAQGLAEEAWQADPQDLSFLPSPELGCHAEEVYEETVRVWGSSHTAQCILSHLATAFLANVTYLVHDEKVSPMCPARSIMPRWRG